jgi:mono/diheme cytochrome c family protein
LTKINPIRPIAAENQIPPTRPEGKMTVRSLIIAALLALPVAAIAEETLDGEALFKAKCQACHTLQQVQGLLEPKPAADRPAHLSKFLKTHPAKLNETEKSAVIGFLSKP